jgi:hypothetical protein
VLLTDRAENVWDEVEVGLTTGRGPLSEATPASFCVGEEPARPLGVAHWTERRKEKGRSREKEAKFPFFIA